VRRRLFSFVSAVSLLLFVLACGTWVGTESEGWTLVRTQGFPTAVWVRMEQDAMFVVVRRHALDVPVTRADWRERPSGRPRLSEWGFGSASMRLWDGAPPAGRPVAQYDLFGATYALLAFGAALLPLAWIAAAMSRRSRARRDVLLRRCPACGYDMRATPQRCPECGTPAGQGDAV
jgi:hypothetical protein